MEYRRRSRYACGRDVPVYVLLSCALALISGCGDDVSPTAPTPLPIAVSVGQGDTHSNARDAATAVGSDSSTQGSLEIEGDVDYFNVVVSSLIVLTVETTGGTDTFGQLESQDGLVIASADAGGSGGNFRIERQVDAGTYFVRVSGAIRAATGGYMLHVRTAEPVEPPPPPQNTPDLTVYGVSVATSPSGTPPGGSLTLSACGSKRRGRNLGGHDVALLPLDGRDDHDLRHRGGHGRGGGAWRRGDEPRVDQPDGAVVGGDVLLRRVRRRGGLGSRPRRTTALDRCRSTCRSLRCRRTRT